MSSTRLFSLGSGSSGNAFLLDTGDVALLFDSGVGIRRMQLHLRELQVQQRLGAVLLSHEHSDHIRSLDAVNRHYRPQLVATPGTVSGARSVHPFDLSVRGTSQTLHGVTVHWIGVDHDAAEPSGWLIEAPGVTVALFTDLGNVSDSVRAAIGVADVVVLESNYDVQMLARGPYPAHLKRRITSSVGHLSNDDCASALVAALTPKTRQVWLAHLSETNNSPRAAVQTNLTALQMNGIDVSVDALPRHDLRDLLATTPRQLGFGADLIG